MSNVIQLPVIAGVEITTDEQGRFNLNALEKAAKANGVTKDIRPNEWMAIQGVQEMIDILITENSISKPIKSKPGRYGGTFAHELLAVSYAGWISPAFQLKVNQVFLDYRSGKVDTPQAPPTRIEILQMALEAEQENQRLQAEVEEIKPKAEALDRIATSDGSLCVTNAAKDLQMRPKDLFAWLSENKWIYRRAGGAGWTAYQDRLQTGYLEHKVTVVTRTDGSEKTTEQVRITPKGLTKLASKISQHAVA